MAHIQFALYFVLVLALITGSLGATINTRRYGRKTGLQLTAADDDVRTAANLVDCLAMCTDEDTCRAVTFTGASECRLNKKGMFIEGTTLTAHSESSVYFQTDAFTTNPPPKTLYQVWRGVKMGDSIIKEVTDTLLSRAYCLQMCDAYTDCVAFSWADLARTCLLASTRPDEAPGDATRVKDGLYETYYPKGCPSSLPIEFEGSCYSIITTHQTPTAHVAQCKVKAANSRLFTATEAARIEMCVHMASAGVSHALTNSIWYGEASGYYDQTTSYYIPLNKYSTGEPNGNEKEPVIELKANCEFNDITVNANRYGSICQAVKEKRACPEGWIDKLDEFGSCYYFPGQKVNYASAKTICSNLHSSAHPPTVTTQEEDDYLMSVMTAKSFTTLLISLTGNPLRWEFEGNGYYIHNGFDENEPNNPAGEQCTAIAVSRGGKWNDMSCSNTGYVGCEIPMNLLPENKELVSIDTV